MFTTVASAVQAIIGFGLLIFVHELGHFFAAKWQGIRVDVFSLGFGPALKKTWRGTEYRLSLIPLGGFVKLAGEEPTPEKEPEPGEFYAKSIGQRCIVFAAGGVVNIVFGFFCFMIAYQVGVPVVPARIGGVEPGSPAWKIGLKHGDTITRIGSYTRDLDFEDLKTSIMLSGRDRVISLEVDRAGERFEVELRPEYRKDKGFMFGGIIPPSTMIVADMKELDQDDKDIVKQFEAAYEAGLRAGDIITGVGVPGDPEIIPVETVGDFLHEVGLTTATEIRIGFARNGVAQTPVTLPTAEDEGWRIGVALDATKKLAAVRSNSWAEAVGLVAGDTITAVGDQNVHSGREILRALDAASEGEVKLTVLRAGADKGSGDHSAVVTVPAVTVTRERARDVIAFEREALFISAVTPGSPAHGAGLRPGDRIISTDGKESEDFKTFHNTIKNSEGGAVTIGWNRDGKKMSAAVTPIRRRTVRLALEPDRVRTQVNVTRSMRLGVRKSYQWTVRVFFMVRGLLSRTISAQHLSSPIGIFVVISHAARDSIGLLLYFLAVISVNLGVLNLLPIPILDGGHILFAGIEKLRGGKAVSEKVRSLASYIGLGLLLAVFARAVWNDLRLFVIEKFFG